MEAIHSVEWIAAFFDIEEGARGFNSSFPS